MQEARRIQGYLDTFSLSAAGVEDRYERARSKRLAVNNVFQYASSFGMNGDDIQYLERNYGRLSSGLNKIEVKLRECLKVFLFISEVIF